MMVDMPSNTTNQLKVYAIMSFIKAVGLHGRF